MGRFYQDVLGFTRTDKGSMPGPGGALLELVFLSRDPEEHHQIVFCSGRPEARPLPTPASCCSGSGRSGSGSSGGSRQQRRWQR